MLGTVGAIEVIHYAMEFGDKINNVVLHGSSESTVSSDIISGKYDTFLRQKCIERLNSYGLDTVSRRFD